MAGCNQEGLQLPDSRYYPKVQFELLHILRRRCTDHTYLGTYF